MNDDASFPRRIDSPSAWAKAFGIALAFAGAVATGREYGLREVLLATCVLGASGAGFGWIWGSVLRWIFGLFGGLERPVKRPELWGNPLRCSSCDWRSTPEGPWSWRDCIQPPSTCPNCGSELVPVVPDCPRCGTCAVAPGSLARGVISQVRWPASLQAGLWGHFTCNSCRCCYDKWGRLVNL